MECRIVCPFKKVVDRNIKKVSKSDERPVVSFTLAALIAADAVLIEVQFYGKPLLCNAPCTAQFFQSHSNITKYDTADFTFSTNILVSY